MKNKIATVFIPIMIFVFVAGGWSLLLAGGERAGESALAGDLIRLHIVANSDSAADQRLKLQVRDAVIAYLAPLLAGAASVDDARRIVVSQRADILRIARQTAAAAGASYPVALETGWYDFPVRSYGSLVLPPGRYEAVRILLGAAEGKNWWCVLFPPLCLIDGTTAVAGSAAQGATAAQSGRVELRWKISEIFAGKTQAR